MFTLVGGGLRSLQDATQPEADVLPQGVDWLRTAAAEIDADSSSITTADGKKLRYEYLVVATGEQYIEGVVTLHALNMLVTTGVQVTVWQMAAEHKEEV
jgi:sulfide:quinone oxidoreductase